MRIAIHRCVDVGWSKSGNISTTDCSQQDIGGLAQDLYGILEKSQPIGLTGAVAGSRQTRNDSTRRACQSRFPGIPGQTQHNLDWPQYENTALWHRRTTGQSDAAKGTFCALPFDVVVAERAPSTKDVAQQDVAR